MSVPTNTQSEKGENIQGVSPGKRLRSAREKSGLSRGEVASHLKLSVEKIESLERDDVNQLAAPVFVAGYLRAYARLVDLPEDEIISDFSALAKMEAPSMDPSTSPAANNFGQLGSATARKGIKSGEKDWSPMAIWGSVVILLAVLMFILFAGDDPESVEKIGERPVNSEKINDADIESSELAAVIDEKIEQDVNEIDVNTKDVEVSERKVELQPVRETMVKQKDTKDIVDTKPAEAELPKELKQETLKHSVIVLNFREDSWVEVIDALGKRHLYRIGKAGTSKTVWGVAPFKIHLGYVPGVDVRFNGEAYDMSIFANRKSVRFNLGKPGDQMGSG